MPTSDRAPGPEALLSMITSAWVPQAIHAAAQLGLADALAGGARTSGDLAAHVGADADALRRLLRALSAVGLVTERDDGAFELTALGGYLRADADPSLRSYALLWGGSMWPIWGTLLHTVKTGKSPRALVTRKESFESLAQNAPALRVFNDAMSEISRLMAVGVVRAHDFSRIRCLVDVGGGHGELLGAILAANPGLRGWRAYLRRVRAGARTRLDAAGVGDRLELAPGSFFGAVPRGGDAYLLKSVLHDWNDERAVAILANVRRAMDGRGAL